MPGNAHRIRRILTRHPLAIEQKPDCLCVLTLPVAKGIHQFLEFGTPLDLKEDFIVVVGDLDVQMLGGLRCLTTIGRLVLVGHLRRVERYLIVLGRSRRSDGVGESALRRSVSNGCGGSRKKISAISCAVGVIYLFGGTEACLARGKKREWCWREVMAKEGAM